MTTGIDSLPYEVYLKLSHMFVPLLVTEWSRGQYNNISAVV